MNKPKQSQVAICIAIVLVVVMLVVGIMVVGKQNGTRSSGSVYPQGTVVGMTEDGQYQVIMYPDGTFEVIPQGANK